MPKSKSKSIIAEHVVKPVPVDIPVKVNFHDSIIKLQSPDFPDEEYLEVDLYDYFERLNRQGWSCVKVKKI